VKTKNALAFGGFVLAAFLAMIYAAIWTDPGMFRDRLVYTACVTLIGGAVAMAGLANYDSDW